MRFFYRVGITISCYLVTVTGLAQPANNNCSGAFTLTANSTCVNTSGTTSGATQSQAGCTGNANDDVWYTFIASSTTETVTVKGSSSFDAVLQVFSGSCGGTSLGCVDNTGNGGTETKALTGLTVGTQYWFRVYDYGSGTPTNPTFNVCVIQPPPPTAQDCNGGLSICANTPFAGNPNGSGTVDDASGANFGCLVGGEHQSSWYYFSPATTGTVGLTITPASTTTDYDWAIWGPMTNITCPPPGAPIRCSAADGNSTPANITGLGNGATDVTEGSGGDGWVSLLNVTAGQKYIMLIDNWTATSSPFTLSWQLAGGASLNCAVLPVGLTEFTGEKVSDQVLLKWTTMTEVNNDYFTVEKSEDAIAFEDIGTVQGAGNSNVQLHYSLWDQKPRTGINYYRLRQTDLSGSYTHSQIISIEFSQSDVMLNNVHPNPTSSDLDFDFYSPVSGTVHVQMIDDIGRIVSDEFKSVEAGKSVINTNMASLAQGIYSLMVSFDRINFSSATKVIRR